MLLLFVAEKLPPVVRRPGGGLLVQRPDAATAARPDADIAQRPGDNTTGAPP